MILPLTDLQTPTPAPGKSVCHTSLKNINQPQPIPAWHSPPASHFLGIIPKLQPSLSLQQHPKPPSPSLTRLRRIALLSVPQMSKLVCSWKCLLQGLCRTSSHWSLRLNVTSLARPPQATLAKWGTCNFLLTSFLISFLFQNICVLSGDHLKSKLAVYFIYAIVAFPLRPNYWITKKFY